MIISAHNVWLIPSLPLIAAAIGALTPRNGRKFAAGAAIAAMAGALVVSILALVTVCSSRGHETGAIAIEEAGLLTTATTPTTFNFRWFDLGTGALELGFLLDPLAALMLVMVTLVGLLIFIFSLGYMKEDANFTRFFCFLSLFAAAMLGLVVSNSLLLLFTCWELVGLASYLLIGFWFHKPAAAAAAKKAFLTTRIGDLGLLLGMLWLYDATGTLLFYNHGLGCLESHATATLLAPTAIALLLFCGAVGKSGQFPLHVWLPDAMEGPTPVSALIHAATMVAAGVFLMARVQPLLELAPDALMVIAAIGAITALLGAVIAVAQHDIKRILAFSTVSQLGYMMLAVGIGAWVAAIFHLLTHAFFKALLFLGAGSVIHANHHEQDIRKLGGLRRSMKLTFAAFAIGMMALAGVPFLFSGFWSKEAILHAAHGWTVSQIPFYVGLSAVVLTAFYMTRLLCEVFFGSSRRSQVEGPALSTSPDTGGAPLGERSAISADDIHESPAVMTVPLMLLAFGAIALGFLGTPYFPWLQRLLDPSYTVEPGGAGLMVLSIVLVGVGIGIGGWIYGRRPRASAEALDPFVRAAPRLFRGLAGRLGIDEFYAATVLRLNSGLAGLADWLDRWIWGGAVRGAAAFGQFWSHGNRQIDEDAINAGFDGASEMLRETGRAYSRAQTGDAHTYLRAIGLAFVVLALLLAWGGGP